MCGRPENEPIRTGRLIEFEQVCFHLWQVGWYAAGASSSDFPKNPPNGIVEVDLQPYLKLPFGLKPLEGYQNVDWLEIRRVYARRSGAVGCVALPCFVVV
jgi:hypothetical protein